jgi:hypothetical protein
MLRLRRCVSIVYKHMLHYLGTVIYTDVCDTSAYSKLALARLQSQRIVVQRVLRYINALVALHR